MCLVDSLCISDALLFLFLGKLETMGVLAAVKKNKVGAVVISVFDWYRKCKRSLSVENPLI